MKSIFHKSRIYDYNINLKILMKNHHLRNSHRTYGYDYWIATLSKLYITKYYKNPFVEFEIDWTVLTCMDKRLFAEGRTDSKCRIAKINYFSVTEELSNHFKTSKETYLGIFEGYGTNTAGKVTLVPIFVSCLEEKDMVVIYFHKKWGKIKFYYCCGWPTKVQIETCWITKF